MRTRTDPAPRTTGRARRALLAVLLPIAAGGCADSTPASPAPRQVPVPTIPPPSPPQAPSIPEPTVRYERVTPLSYGASDAYLLSLSADSTFAIIFPNGRTFAAWSGRYSRSDSVLTFRYVAWSAAGELLARGTIRGDTLLLRYNTIMQLTDFEDGDYVRVSVGP